MHAERQGELYGGESPDLVDLLEHVDASQLPEERWPQTLADLVDVLTATFKRNGQGDDEAFAAAQKAVLAIAHYLGGRPVYLPKGDALDRALRDEQIFREANRYNIDNIAAKLGFSRRAVEKIVARQALLHRRKLQGRLFED